MGRSANTVRVGFSGCVSCVIVRQNPEWEFAPCTKHHAIASDAAQGPLYAVVRAPTNITTSVPDVWHPSDVNSELRQPVALATAEGA